MALFQIITSSSDEALSSIQNFKPQYLPESKHVFHRLANVALKLLLHPSRNYHRSACTSYNVRICLPVLVTTSCEHKGLPTY